MMITARVHNRRIELPPEVHVAEGAEVQIVLPSTEAQSGSNPAPKTFFESVHDLIGSIDGPEDLSAEHDHYAHGTPKRGLR